MTLREREQQLLTLVETYQAEECRRLLGEAQTRGRTLLCEAYRNARHTLHQRVLAERARARARVEAAEAELATRERRAIEHLHWQLLEVGWPRLRELLLERWHSPQGRWVWVERATRAALRSLPLGQWLIQHPPELGGDELTRLGEMLAPRLPEPPQFAIDTTLAAGVRIQSGAAILDATLEGLLTDRRRLEARLLGVFAQEGA